MLSPLFYMNEGSQEHRGAGVYECTFSPFAQRFIRVKHSHTKQKANQVPPLPDDVKFNDRHRGSLSWPATLKNQRLLLV